MLGESLGFFEGVEIVGFSFAIPFFQGAESSDGDRHGDCLSILRVDQAFLLEIGKSWRFTLTFEWETSCPVVVFLPVTMQDLDISVGLVTCGSIAQALNPV